MPTIKERGRSPELEIDSTVVWVVPLTADQAKIDSTVDRANHRKTSNPSWPSHLCCTVLPLPPLDQTQSPLSLPSSLNLTIFDEFFLLGLVYFLFIYWEMILCTCLEAEKCEKLWATSIQCVFYSIFKNITKHKKIFFKVFFKMPPNT